MRLLEINTHGSITLIQVPAGNIPPYAILSHTWGAEEDEVSFADMLGGTHKDRKGYKKIEACGKQAAQDGLQFFWVDTCCIDKSSSSELTESINSMYQWYKNARICYAFLADVPSEQRHSQFESQFWKSRWFTRGWTLQELVAPREVEFYNAKWRPIGSRRQHKLLIQRITGIDIRVLEGADPATCNVAQRMSWAWMRNTTRVEDKAYSLLGLFGVNMPMLYGERENAFIRLQEEILKSTEDYSLFAWHEHEQDQESTPTMKPIYRGVLAYSPANFCRLSCTNCVQPRTWDYSELEYVPWDNSICGRASDGDPPLLSVRGVRLNLPACPRDSSTDKDSLAYLYCRVGPRRVCLRLSPTCPRNRNFNNKGVECVTNIVPKKFKLTTINLCGNTTDSGQTPTGLLLNGISADENSEPPASQTASLPPDPNWETPSSQLVKAAEEGKIAAVRETLKKVLDVNTKSSGWTALGKAAKSGHIDIVRLLLANGAHLNITMDKGWGIMPGGGTALHWAADRGHLEIVKLLVREGADMDIHVPQSAWFKSGTTAVSAAAGNGHLNIVKFLLDAGADRTSEEGIAGWDAFTWACQKEQKAIVRYFMEDHGSFDINRRNKDGMTPLMFAAAGGGTSLMEILIHKGAELGIRDGQGRTPLHHAVGSWKLNAVSFLRKRGVDANARDIHGKSALDLAKESKEDSLIVKYLKSESLEPEEEEPGCVVM